MSKEPSYDAYLDRCLWQQEREQQEALGRAIEDGEVCPKCLAEFDYDEEQDEKYCSNCDQPCDQPSLETANDYGEGSYYNYFDGEN